MKIEFNDNAFIKPIIHASKFPWAPVSGFFIGKKGIAMKKVVSDEDDANVDDKGKGKKVFDKDNDNDDVISVVDAIPIFHNSIVLPVLEIAAMIMSEYAADSGLVIVGYYSANQRCDDTSPNIVAKKVTQKIISLFPDGFLAVINNEKIANEKSFPFSVYQGQQLESLVSNPDEAEIQSSTTSVTSKKGKSSSNQIILSKPLLEIQSQLTKILQKGDYEKWKI